MKCPVVCGRRTQAKCDEPGNRWRPVTFDPDITEHVSVSVTPDDRLAAVETAFSRLLTYLDGRELLSTPEVETLRNLLDSDDRFRHPA